ncbi:MAG: hypothetical protein CV087_04660 [Candidatus Brocadia sp. WS118]|nr:MAG: hypothetical protein CV087_04660 [Candidatus Brocadia sp. WS118]
MIQKNALVSLLKGYRKANELIAEEKKRRLAHLTTKDSLREYIALCELAEEGVKSEDIEKLQKKKIEFLLKRRNLLDGVKR